MAWKQVLSPNLDNDPKKPLYVYQSGKILTDWYGWCLAVVAASYGAKGSSYSAKTAWQSCNTKHKDRNIPEGIYVPMWYEGGQYGHVVIGYRKGNSITIYSSPYTHKPTFQVFSGDLNQMLNYIGQVYGVGSFSGWSETVLNSRVIEYKSETPKKSNEEICKEIWEGKWGVGKDREKRLTEAGYNYATIQKMIDAGVGKPEPQTKPQEPSQDDKGDETVNEPTKPEEPTQNGSQEPTEQDSSEPQPTLSPDTSSGNSNQPDSETNSDGNIAGAQDEYAPVENQNAQLIGGIIDEVGEGFEFSQTTKLIAYLVGDALLVGALLVPDIVNTIQAPNPAIFAEYLSKVLLEGGIAILTVFKLFKRKGK